MIEFLALAVIVTMIILFMKSNKNARNSDAVLWHHKLNSWIILNLSSLNAYLFIIIVLFFAIYGWNIGRWYMTQNGEIIGLLLGAVFGFVIGFIYCGLFSIILTLSKDISRIANCREEKKNN